MKKQKNKNSSVEKLYDSTNIVQELSKVWLYLPFAKNFGEFVSLNFICVVLEVKFCY